MTGVELIKYLNDVADDGYDIYLDRPVYVAVGRNGERHSLEHVELSEHYGKGKVSDLHRTCITLRSEW